MNSMERLSGEIYSGRSKATNRTLNGLGRMDNGRCFIGEKVDNLGYRWYEVFPSTFRKLKGRNTKIEQSR